MAAVDNALQRQVGLISSIGKSALASLYPSDFELYIIAFDLVNSDGETEAYFLFPVQPFSINEGYKPIQSIKKTAGGVTVLSTQTFVPTTTMMQGNFGRKFRFLLGKELVNFSALLNQPSPTKPLFATEFDPQIKTGYGCIKVLEAIVKRSNALDSKGKPYALFLYNLALSHNYLVKVSSLDLYQNQENNMIWHYSLGITSLIPTEQITSSTATTIAASLAVSSAVTKSVNGVNGFLNTVVGSLTGTRPVV